MTKAQVEQKLVPEAFHPFLLLSGDLAIVVHKPEEVALAAADTLKITRSDGQAFLIPFSAINSIDWVHE